MVGVCLGVGFGVDVRGLVIVFLWLVVCGHSFGFWVCLYFSIYLLCYLLFNLNPR